MPVKNISAIGPSGNVKPIPIYHVIPPTDKAIIKITVDTSSGEIDITDLITQGTFNVGHTTTIGDFDLSFIDPEKTNYNLISLFDDIYIYADYGTEATTKRFRFKIESKGYSNSKTNLVGRGIGMILADKSIIYETLDSDGNQTYKNKSTVIQEIIEENFSDITDFSNIETDTTQIQKSYFEIPFFDIIEELCGDDKIFYLDKDLKPYFLTKGSVTNEQEAIVSGNLIEVKDNSDNAEEIYTRVRVYGKSEDGIPIIYTYNMGTTNTSGINKDYVINNTSVTSTTQAQLLAEAKADELVSSTQIGDLVSFLLPTLVPGERLFVSLPEHDIDPGYFNIKEFSIELDNQGDYAYKTNFIIERKRLSTPTVIKEIIQSQKGIADNDNPNDLDFSRIITFTEDSGTHYDSEINEDYLKVSSGKSTAYWESDTYSLTNNLSQIEIRWSGDLLVGDYASTSSQIWYSTNGGATWNLAINGKLDTSVDTGKDLRIKLVLNQSDARVKRVGIYYSY